MSYLLEIIFSSISAAMFAFIAGLYITEDHTALGIAWAVVSVLRVVCVIMLSIEMRDGNGEHEGNNCDH